MNPYRSLFEDEESGNEKKENPQVSDTNENVIDDLNKNVIIFNFLK